VVYEYFGGLWKGLHQRFIEGFKERFIEGFKERFIEGFKERFIEGFKERFIEMHCIMRSRREPLENH